MRLMVSIVAIVVSTLAWGETIALSPIGGAASSASESTSVADVVKVRGKGVGTTRDEALKDAYRDAVERAVGLFVDAEQMVKNDELITDQVLTQSNAYIEKYDLVKESKGNGLIKIEIDAVVRKSELVKKVSSMMPVQNVALGTALQNLHAQIVTTDKRARDGAALLKKALAGVDPVEMLIKPGICPETQKVTREGSYDWFEGRNIPAGKVGLSYVFKLELDRKKYFAEFIPKLKQILGQISIKPAKEFRITALRESAHDSRLHYLDDYLRGGEGRNTRTDLEGSHESGFYRPLEVFSGLVDGKTYAWGARFGYFDGGRNVIRIVTDGKCMADWQLENVSAGEFVLVTELNEKNTMGKAVRYVLDVEEVKCLCEWMEACGCYVPSSVEKREKSDTITYNILFKDKDGGEVALFPWKLSRRHLTNVGTAIAYGRENGMQSNVCWFYVAPLVGCAGGSFIQWRDFVLEKDDLAKIASVSIELAE